MCPLRSIASSVARLPTILKSALPFVQLRYTGFWSLKLCMPNPVPRLRVRRLRPRRPTLLQAAVFLGRRPAEPLQPIDVFNFYGRTFHTLESNEVLYWPVRDIFFVRSIFYEWIAVPPAWRSSRHRAEFRRLWWRYCRCSHAGNPFSQLSLFAFRDNVEFD